MQRASRRPVIEAWFLTPSCHLRSTTGNSWGAWRSAYWRPQFDQPSTQACKDEPSRTGRSSGVRPTSEPSTRPSTRACHGTGCKGPLSGATAAKNSAASCWRPSKRRPLAKDRTAKEEYRLRGLGLAETLISARTGSTPLTGMS